MLAKDNFICEGCSAILPISIKVVRCLPGIILKEFGEENNVNPVIVRR